MATPMPAPIAAPIAIQMRSTMAPVTTKAITPPIRAIRVTGFIRDVSERCAIVPPFVVVGSTYPRAPTSTLGAKAFGALEVRDEVVHSLRTRVRVALTQQRRRVNRGDGDTLA